MKLKIFALVILYFYLILLLSLKFCCCLITLYSKSREHFSFSQRAAYKRTKSFTVMLYGNNCILNIQLILSYVRSIANVNVMRQTTDVEFFADISVCTSSI